MICKTFPGLIAHQIIRDNRLWRRDMYGEGKAGGAWEAAEEIELWGAATAANHASSNATKPVASPAAAATNIPGPITAPAANAAAAK